MGSKDRSQSGNLWGREEGKRTKFEENRNQKQHTLTGTTVLLRDRNPKQSINNRFQSPPTIHTVRNSTLQEWRGSLRVTCRLPPRPKRSGIVKSSAYFEPHVGHLLRIPVKIEGQCESWVYSSTRMTRGSAGAVHSLFGFVGSEMLFGLICFA